MKRPIQREGLAGMNESDIARIEQGTGPQKWVIYSTYDAAGCAAPHAADQLSEYESLGFSTLVVDTSPTLSAERKQQWQRLATEWLQRPNEGYDFGSYSAGLKLLLEKRGFSAQNLELIFANDSCFGPFIPMRDVMNRFDAYPADGRHVFGITDSYQIIHHIQSYWLYFRADVTPLAEAFFQQMTPATNREEAINQGEIALSAFLQDHGCVLRAYCPVRDMVSTFARFHGVVPSLLELGIRRLLNRPKYNRSADAQCLRYLLRRPEKLRFFNPALLFGSHTYRWRVSPFIKKSLLRDNVYEEPGIPAGLEPSGLTNEEVARVLEQSISRRHADQQSHRRSS